MCFNFRYTVIPLVHKHADVSLFVSPYKWAFRNTYFGTTHINSTLMYDS